MSAKRRVRKTVKKIRRNNDVNPRNPLRPVPRKHEELPAEEARSRAAHPAQGVSAVFDEVSLKENVQILDVSSLYPEVVGRISEAEFSVLYGKLGREAADINTLYGKSLVNAEEALRATEASDTAPSDSARGSEVSEGQPSPEQEAEPQGRTTTEERYEDILDIEAIVQGGRHSLKRLPFDEGRLDELFPDTPAERVDPATQEAREDWVKQVLRNADLDPFGRHSDVTTPLADWELELLYGRPAHLVHLEKEVNLLPVHAGSSTCFCDIGKDHWKELGEIS